MNVPGQRSFVGVAAVAISCLCARQAAALDVLDAYSTWNRTRPRQSVTRYIVLHTTEAPDESSLNSLRANGEAHYMVDTRGRVYAVIQRGKIATHAGRSMWDGNRNLDNCSIGIEVVGNYNRPITAAQYAALGELLRQLRRIYSIPDDHVLCHSMVAYGVPNRWHPQSHRGRKRCGALFASPTVRRKLGLRGKPAFDPDVRAGRLVVGDPWLAMALYGEGMEKEPPSTPRRSAEDNPNVVSSDRSVWGVAGDMFDSPRTLYVLPDGRKLRGDEVTDWRKVPIGTRVTVSSDQRSDLPDGLISVDRDGRSARDVAGEDHAKKTTIYFLPKGVVRRGDELKPDVVSRLPIGTKVLVGYIYGGYVTDKRSAKDICGKRWNYPSTFYRLSDGTMRNGTSFRDGRVPKGTLVFFRD